MKPWYSIGTVLCLVLYVLSFGPDCSSYFARNRTLQLSSTLEVFYFPIEWASKHSRMIDGASSWYLDQWSPSKWDMPRYHHDDPSGGRSE